MKPIFVVLFCSTLGRLRLAKFDKTNPDPDDICIYAAKIKSKSIEEFLQKELRFKYNVTEIIKPVASGSSSEPLGKTGLDVFRYNDHVIEVKNVEVVHTLIHEDEHGVYYAVAERIQMATGKINASKPTVVYTIDTIREGRESSDSRAAQITKILCDYFDANEARLLDTLLYKTELPDYEKKRSLESCNYLPDAK